MTFTDGSNACTCAAVGQTRAAGFVQPDDINSDPVAFRRYAAGWVAMRMPLPILPRSGSRHGICRLNFDSETPEHIGKRSFSDDVGAHIVICDHVVGRTFHEADATACVAGDQVAGNGVVVGSGNVVDVGNNGAEFIACGAGK